MVWPQNQISSPLQAVGLATLRGDEELDNTDTQEIVLNLSPGTLGFKPREIDLYFYATEDISAAKSFSIDGGSNYLPLEAINVDADSEYSATIRVMGDRIKLLFTSGVDNTRLIWEIVIRSSVTGAGATEGSLGALAEALQDDDSNLIFTE